MIFLINTSCHANELDRCVLEMSDVLAVDMKIVVCVFVSPSGDGLERHSKLILYYFFYIHM